LSRIDRSSARFVSASSYILDKSAPMTAPPASAVNFTNIVPKLLIACPFLFYQIMDTLF
jgi:hypothetical protein